MKANLEMKPPNIGPRSCWMAPYQGLAAIPYLMPSNVLPFYVTVEIWSIECPGLAALSTQSDPVNNSQEKKSFRKDFNTL